jgi:ABC-type multidrug transport system permease subunit
MEQNEEMEMQIWDYMDGLATPGEKQRISELIEQDEAWREKFQQLQALQTTLLQNLELDQPSMRFTKNIMEAITATSITPATAKYINKSIIRSIAAFFIITITAFTGYALLTLNWHTGTTHLIPELNYKAISLTQLFDSNMLNLVIAINIVLALVLADKIIRKQIHSKYTPE